MCVGGIDANHITFAVLATGLGGTRDERRGEVGGIFAHIDERERLRIGTTRDLGLSRVEKGIVCALLACSDVDGLEEELGKSIVGRGGEDVG